jgi:hypothetical protein
MSKQSGTKRIEANREQMLKWEREGRSYFWMASKVGIGNRNVSAVSKWFVAQGIRRRATK